MQSKRSFFYGYWSTGLIHFQPKGAENSLHRFLVLRSFLFQSGAFFINTTFSLPKLSIKQILVQNEAARWESVFYRQALIPSQQLAQLNESEANTIISNLGKNNLLYIPFH